MLLDAAQSIVPPDYYHEGIMPQHKPLYHAHLTISYTDIVGSCSPAGLKMATELKSNWQGYCSVYVPAAACGMSGVCCMPSPRLHAGPMPSKHEVHPPPDNAVKVCCRPALPGSVSVKVVKKYILEMLSSSKAVSNCTTVVESSCIRTSLTVTADNSSPGRCSGLRMALLKQRARRTGTSSSAVRHALPGCQAGSGQICQISVLRRT